MNAILNIAHASVLRNWKLILFPLVAVMAVLGLAIFGVRTTDASAAGSFMRALTLFPIALAAIPAGVMGLNLFAPDVRERKLGFFLSRPCTPLQLWLGRLLGATLICLVGWAVATFVMPMLGGADGLVERGPVATLPGLVLAVILLGLALIGNSAAILLAANSMRWFILDIAAGFILFGLTFWTLGQALTQGSPRYAADQALVLILGMLVALFFSGLAFLSAKDDTGASRHRAHSLTFWLFTAVLLLLLAAHREYEWRRPLSSELSSEATDRSPRSTSNAFTPSKALITVMGLRNPSMFVLDTKSGASERLTGFAGMWPVANIGALAYVEQRLEITAPAFVSNHLVISRGDSKTALDVRTPYFGRVVDVTQAGDLALFANVNGFEVVRTDTGGRVFRDSTRPIRSATFMSNGQIAVTSAGDAGAPLLSMFDLEGKRVGERTFPAPGGAWTLTADRSADRVAITENGRETTLYDRDGTQILRVVPKAPAGGPASRLRGGSREAVLFNRAGDLIIAMNEGLKTVRHDESVVRDVPLTFEGQTLTIEGFRWISGEFASGDIVIGELENGVFSSLIAEASTGVVRVKLKGLRTIARRDVTRFNDFAASTDDAALRLFENDRADLLVLDEGATAPRMLVKASGPSL